MGRPMRRFLFRLAIHVYGKAHPDHIPDKLTPRQLAESMAYARIEPWGPDRDAWHAAGISASIAQQFTKKKLKVKDFVLNFEPKRRDRRSMSDKLKEVAYRIGSKMVSKKGN